MSVFIRVTATPISNGSFWSRDNDEYNRTASNVFNNLHNLCSDAEFCVYLAYILFYQGLILRAEPVVFSGKCLLLKQTVTIISHTTNTLGIMGTSIRHSDFWNRWSMVFEASMDQSQLSNACLHKWSQKSLRRRLVPNCLVVSGMGNW